MQPIYRVQVLLLLFSCALFIAAQDAPSLGDVARQSRQQKQVKGTQPQSKSSAAPKRPRIITNEEMPGRVVSVAAHPGAGSQFSGTGDAQQPQEGKLSADAWRSQIQNQKNAVTSLQAQVDQMNESIHFAPGNCVANCVEWNQRQREKQQQVEQMKSQLEDEKKKLGDMQDGARKQGYGGSVYDP